MLKRNLQLAIRSFKKYKSSFFINLFGLSAGLVCTLLIFMWVRDEVSKDNFQPDNLYQVMEHQQYSDRIMTFSATPGLLADALSEEIPEVEVPTAMSGTSSFVLAVNEQEELRATGVYADKRFFQVFNFPLLKGDANNLLSDKKSIVISEKLAIDLFSSTDVLGKTIIFQREEQYTVSGIFKEIPKNSSLTFDFVLPFEKYKDLNQWASTWTSNGPRTYLRLKEGVDHESVSKKIAGFVKEKNESSNVTLFLKPYADRYLYGSYENGQLVGGRIEYVRMFSLIAILVLIIACINFMNLSTARASRRLKEIGIKKAVGANRGSLILQFLTESILISFGALLFALVLVAAFIPEFNNITGKDLEFTFQIKELIYILSGALFTGLLAGSYPALYLSGFSSVAILKKEVKSSLGEIWTRRGMVVFQFAISVFLIVSVIVVYSQIQYIQNKNIGYDKENIMYFPVEGKSESSMSTFLRELKAIPGVLDASSSSHTMIGRNTNTSGLHWEGKDPESLILFESVYVNQEYIETMGFEMVEGRSFSPDFVADTNRVVLNETAVKIMGFQDDPIGKVFRLWDQYDLEIIGVVKDFNYQSLHQEVKPLYMWLKPQYTRYIVLRLQAGEQKSTIEEVSKFYASFNPGFTLDFNFIDKAYERQYDSEKRVAALSKYFAGFAIIISCLGLFGLAAFTAERRMKEIGIRKALGSSSQNIVLLLSKDFTALVILAIVLAMPVSYWAIENWLERFAYRINLDVWFFIISGVIALLIAWLAVGGQAIKAARVNPVKCLRDD